MEYGWIAATPEEARAVLHSAAFHPRPPDEPVPKAMRATALAPIFERLVRMNDGQRHTRLRARVEERIARWSEDDVRNLAAVATALVAPQDVGGYVVAALTGIADPKGALPWIRDFAAAIAPGASDDAIARGAQAAQPLIDALPPCEDPDELANTLGFLFQSYAATARLIENMLARRTDAPAPLTRRYAVEETVICETRIRKGDTVIVLLTGPELHFGAGRHACPGEHIARTIARAAVPLISLQQR